VPRKNSSWLINSCHYATSRAEGTWRWRPAAHLRLKRASTKLESVLVAWHVTRLCSAKGDQQEPSQRKIPSGADAMKRGGEQLPGVGPARGSMGRGEGHLPLPGAPERRNVLAERAPRRSARREVRMRGDDGLAMGTPRDMRGEREESEGCGWGCVVLELAAELGLFSSRPELESRRTRAVCRARAETFLDPHFSLTYLADPLSLLPSPSISQRRRRRIARLPRSPAPLGP
jgi:hypothetical protein